MAATASHRKAVIPRGAAAAVALPTYRVTPPDSRAAWAFPSAATPAAGDGSAPVVQERAEWTSSVAAGTTTDAPVWLAVSLPHLQPLSPVLMLLVSAAMREVTAGEQPRMESLTAALRRPGRSAESKARSESPAALRGTEPSAARTTAEAASGQAPREPRAIRVVQRRRRVAQILRRSWYRQKWR